MRQRGEADFAPPSVGRATRRETRLTSRESPPSERRLQLICDAVRRASGSLPGGGRPSESGMCPSSRAWCRAGCRCPLASCGNTHQRSEDQIDQQHFSFRLRLCGRRAWLARQLMLPRAAPESGTRGRISALPCLASPRESVRLLRFAASPRTAATQRAFSRWPAGRGGPGARAEVAVAAVVAATLCGPSLASARLHWRGAGAELGHAGRPEER